MFHTEL